MILTNGVTRIVILKGNYAYKIPHLLNGWRMFLNGLLANMQEKEWSGFSPKLCPVIFSLPGGFLVIQKRAQILSNEQWENLDLINFCKHDDTILPIEHKRCSFGTLNNNIVAVDYG